MGYTIDGDIVFTNTLPELKEAFMPRTKKETKPKINLEQTIEAIVQKYVVVREGPLGIAKYIPYSKIPDLIKDINQLVLDYLASLPKKKAKKVNEVDELLEKTTKKIWDKIKKDVERQQHADDAYPYPLPDQFDPFRKDYTRPPKPMAPRPGVWMSDSIPPTTRG